MSVKPSYILVNGRNFAGFIYIEPEHGRTIILTQNLNLNSPLEIYKPGEQNPIDDIDFVEFLRQRLPHS